MIKTKYFKEENIIFIERSGEIFLQDLINHIQDLDKNFQSVKDMYILEDIRDSISKFEEKDYPVLINEIKNKISKFNKVRSAIVVDNPKNTVLSILFEQLSSEIDNYNYKTFSTIEAAKQWLKYDI